MLALLVISSSLVTGYAAEPELTGRKFLPGTAKLWNSRLDSGLGILSQIIYLPDKSWRIQLVMKATNHTFVYQPPCEYSVPAIYILTETHKKIFI